MFDTAQPFDSRSGLTYRYSSNIDTSGVFAILDTQIISP